MAMDHKRNSSNSIDSTFQLKPLRIDYRVAQLQHPDYSIVQWQKLFQPNKTIKDKKLKS
jgi:hypothetical protein